MKSPVDLVKIVVILRTTLRVSVQQRPSRESRRSINAELLNADVRSSRLCHV